MCETCIIVILRIALGYQIDSNNVDNLVEMRKTYVLKLN